MNDVDGMVQQLVESVLDARASDDRSDLADSLLASSESIDEMFRAFSDRTRLRILQLLLRGEICVGDLATVLAVCSCSVLPMFAGIYRIGAGLGPAACFLYAGPAINVLAIFLTARVLGFELGIARVIGAMVFGVIIGLIMAVLFRRSEDERSEVTMAQPDPPAASRPLWQNASMLAAMLAFLAFSDWFNPGDKIVQLFYFATLTEAPKVPSFGRTSA